MSEQMIRKQLAEALAVEASVRARIVDKEKLVLAKDANGEEISKAAILAKAKEIALKIKADVDAGRLNNIVLVSLMDGAFPFANLVQQELSALKCPYLFATLQVSSYQGTSSGQLSIQSKLKVPVAMRDVIIVDDVVDTGQTIFLLQEELRLQGANDEIRVACLIDKAQKRRNPFPIHYAGYQLASTDFLIGEGMDYYGFLRDLDGVYVVDPSTLPTEDEEKILRDIPRLSKELENCLREEKKMREKVATKALAAKSMFVPVSTELAGLENLCNRFTHRPGGMAFGEM